MDGCARAGCDFGLLGWYPAYRRVQAGGKVIIWGDLVCYDPVANAVGTWGGIKTLYR